MAAPVGPGSAPGPSSATGPSGASALSGGTPVLLPDGWTATVTDRIVTTVDSVRSKTTTPIETISRAIIWGLLIATAGTAALVVLLIGVLRLGYEALGRVPGIDDRAGRSVWIIDVLLGVVLLVAGLLLLKRGKAPTPED